MPELLDQYKCPTGHRGRVVAALMNKRHEALTLWGLTHVNIKLITENRAEIRKGSVEKTGFPDNFFDLVTAIETYYFWLILPDALKEIKRVLKPGGRLLMVNEMVKDGVYEVENAEMVEKTQVRLVPLEEIKQIMESVGFADVQVFTKAESPWNAVLARK
jgi:SAM-dependent methyltransferase